MSTVTLKSVGKASIPYVFSLVSQNWGPWNPFLWVTTSCLNQNSSNNTRIFGPTPWPYRVFISLPCYRLSHNFRRSRNTKNSGSWSTLANYCNSLSYIIAVPTPLHEQNPCKTSCNWTTDLIWVYIITYNTSQTTYIRLIPQVSAFTFGISTRMVHPSSVSMDLASHTNWTICTSLCHRVGLGGIVEVSARYASLRHICICSACRWVWPPDLFLLRLLTAASNSPLVGVS